MPDLFGFEIPNPFSVASNIYAQVKTDERQADAQEFNASQAEIQRDYQTKMANSAWQRGMTDMKAAGLNPILAYQKGPASSPTGAAASTSFTPASSIADPGISSAIQSKRVNAEVENMNVQNKNIQAQFALIAAQTANQNASTANTAAETAIKLEALKAAQAKGAFSETDKNFAESSFGKLMRWIGNAGREANPFLPSTSVHPGSTSTTTESGDGPSGPSTRTRVIVNRPSWR